MSDNPFDKPREARIAVLESRLQTAERELEEAQAMLSDNQARYSTMLNDMRLERDEARAELAQGGTLRWSKHQREEESLKAQLDQARALLREFDEQMSWREVDVDWDERRRAFLSTKKGNTG